MTLGKVKSVDHEQNASAVKLLIFNTLNFKNIFINHKF